MSWKRINLILPDHRRVPCPLVETQNAELVVCRLAGLSPPVCLESVTTRQKRLPLFSHLEHKAWYRVRLLPRWELLHCAVSDCLASLTDEVPVNRTKAPDSLDSESSAIRNIIVLSSDEEALLSSEPPLLFPSPTEPPLMTTNGCNHSVEVVHPPRSPKIELSSSLDQDLEEESESELESESEFDSELSDFFEESSDQESGNEELLALEEDNTRLLKRDQESGNEELLASEEDNTRPLKRQKLRQPVTWSHDTSSIKWFVPAHHIESKSLESSTNSLMTLSKRSRWLAFGRDHPEWLAEASSLAAVIPRFPPKDLEIRVPVPLLETGVLSNPQLDVVVSAASVFKRSLLLDQGGYFLGEGTGCGKGRTISCLILHLWNHGYRRHMWVSVSKDLMLDAIRDLQDIGAGHIPVFSLHIVKADVAIDSLKGKEMIAKDLAKRGWRWGGEGILFTTYALLSRGEKNLDQWVRQQPPDRLPALIAAHPPSSRFWQAVKWLNGAPKTMRTGWQNSTSDTWLSEADAMYSFIPESARCGGLIAFDEAHKAKNLSYAACTSLKKAAGSASGAAVAACSLALKACPVIYSSATGASEVRNLAYVSRLGIWGPGKPFDSFQAFFKSVKSGGVAAMESFAMDMKALGCYSCRVLSFKDIVFEMVNVDSSAVFRKQYDDVAAILTAMLHHIRQVFRSLEGERRFQEVMAGSFPESAKWLNQFWGLQQRVFKQLLVTQKVQKVVQLTEDCIRQDKQVVISLWTTGEAALKSLCGEEITDFVAVVKVGMQNMMAKWWATGYPRTFPEEYTDLVRRIENLDLPPNPLDDLILKLGGPSRVAELSGRSVRLVKTANGVSMVCRKAVNCESVNVEEARAFQTGLKRVAIITEAASQGISLHADKSRGPSRVRVMMCLELPWAADKAVQQFGRVHRSNQEFCPEYRLLVSDIGGERRFVACIASRMKMMGAITKGDRRAAFASSNAQLEDGEVNPQGVSLLDFDVYSHHGYQARRILLNYLRFASGATPHPPDFKVPHMKFIKEYGSTSDFANLVMDHMCTFQLDTPDVGHAGSQHMDRFLNRMLLMPVRIQNHLFEVFVSIFNTLVQFALDAGELDLGLEDVNWSHGYYRSATLIGREVLYYDEASELNTVHLCYRLDRGVTWAQAVAALSKTKRRSFEGFYLYYNRGMESTALVLQRKGYFGEESGTRVLIVKPNSGPEVRQGSSVATLEAIMLSSWRKVSEDDFDKAQALWSRCYDMAADICMHRQWGYQCKRAQCSFGMRYIRKCVIAVNLIRLWSKLQEFLQSSVEFFDDDGILQKTQRKLHLAKILDADNNSIVGVQVTHELGTVIREKLNEQEADCEELSIVGTRGHVF